MTGFIKWMEKHFVPVAARIGGQRHLVAIRDGFIALMPLVMAGSLAVLLNNLFFTPASLVATWFNLKPETSGYLQFTTKYLQPFMGNIWWGTFAILALVLVFTVAYSLAKSYEVNPLSAAVVAVAGYLALTPQGVTVTLADGKTTQGTWGNFGWQYFNFGALLTAIIVTLVITQIFVTLMRKNLTFKLPENVPPAVGRAFAAIIPGLIAIMVGGLVPVLFSILNEAKILTDTNLFDLITRVITDPFMHLSQNPFSAIIYVLAIQILWFFGLHGGNMMGAITSAIYLPAVAANANGGHNVFTSVFFDSFVHIGGAGATLALVIAIFIASKRSDWREISKIGGGASVFQINEPIMFGLPVVLSPILIIPFLIVPVILTLIAYLATVFGFIGYTNVVVPWVTPVGISAFLATSGDIKAALVAVINLVVAIIIYYPFVMLANRYESEKL
ncbi:PTS sugar transporter subunit IIC [Neobacillus piezotolerans]|uniref:Permease IIC component n=1 Tax=Neobacillus piezotolerans TaxID=2259171 RepID=A0A3D8GUE8_9BACI|nr:PTS transporter subunit EIIC [Neobacillus piezotolerans]RDU37839.1 PTS sugar transporter subunit IIC [Neobacillus piezotolerans]